MMETMKLKTHIGSDGLLKLEVPVGFTDVDCDVVLVYTVETNPVTDEDWEAFVNATYGILADDPIERGDQGQSEIRKELL